MSMKAVIRDSLFVIRESGEAALLRFPISNHQSPITLPKGALA